MPDSDLKYLNAINILVFAKVDALQKINDRFGGDWERAWRSDLSSFLPRFKNEFGKLVPANCRLLKSRIDPVKEWQFVLKAGIQLLTINDAAYPDLLRHIPHPPFLLYIRGAMDVWTGNCVAVVGTRRLSEYGKRSATHLSHGLAAAGLTIVSGLASGIDTLAHLAALDVGAKTIAVLGSGVDDRAVFPPRNLDMARRIVKTGGAVLSEYAPGTHGNQFTFPQRNRIISGLSRGVLIVEADEKSGAMITAKCAIDQDRDVFVVPGSMFSVTSRGPNKLIKLGAKAVTSAEDILEEYDIFFKKGGSTIVAANETEAKIIAVLQGDPLDPNEIMRRTGLGIAEINTALAVMEINNKIKNLGNNKFILYN